MQLSIFSSAGLPANHSASPDYEKDWLIRVATSCSPILQLLTNIGPHGWFVMAAMQVRRLTPMECERLQGFSDGYTAITVRGKSAADSPRYKAIGNSMAVPVMRWIGERIHTVKQVIGEKVSA